jgi:sec-independent protein translocase protein TatC
MSPEQSAPDDPFAGTRMTFGEHLEDLSRHLWRAVYGFLIGLVFSFIFLGRPALRFISAPVEEQLAEFRASRASELQHELDEKNPELADLNRPIDVRISVDRAELLKQLQLNAPPAVPEGQGRVELSARLEEPLRAILASQRAQQAVNRRPELSTLSVQEAFMAWVKVSMACGLILGSPWIFWQIWLFVAAGLYPHERRLVNVYLPFSLGLFLAGVLICQFVVIPKAVGALLWFNQWLGLEPELRFNEWLGFAILMPLIFGISFQLPLVMMFLERVGIFTTQTYVRKWRIACFIIHAFAAIVVPSGDIYSMEFLALPMFGLYGLGILLCRFNPRKRDEESDVPHPDEMVEV